MFESRDPTVAQALAYPRLLGDIGGTNARFGWQTADDAPITHVQVMLCAEHESLLAAAQTYLNEQGLSAPPCAAFGIANPVTGDQVAMTNIGGGIVPRLGERFVASPFRERFEAKGRFKKYLQDVPTWVIHSPVSPALQGASQALSLTQW